MTLHSVLGKGSWGTVWRGEWRGLPIALKTLVFEAEESDVRAALQHLPSLTAGGNGSEFVGLGKPAGGSEEGPAAEGGRVAGVQKRSRAIMEAAIAASVGHRNLVSVARADSPPRRASRRR